MTKLEQAARQALDALVVAEEFVDRHSEDWYISGQKNLKQIRETITTLREALAEQESKCKDHPDAPHGFDRNASHSAGRYVCECEGWVPDVMDWLSKKPVAVLYVKYGRDPEIWATPNVEGFPEGEHKLYAAPVRTKDLTDDELAKAAGFHELLPQELYIARAVIAAYKEKNK